MLDVGGVLIGPDYDIYAPAMAAAGLSPDTEAFVRGHYAGMVAMDGSGDLAWPVYFQALARSCGADEAAVLAVASALEATWDRPGVWSRALPGALEGLARLAATGAALAMVSNSDGSAEESLRLAGVAQVGPGAGVAVSVVIDSQRVGVEKPDPAIFAIALEAVGVDAERAVHVGDTVLWDVRGAQRAGVHPLHLDPFELCPERADHDHVRSLAEVAQLVHSRQT